MPVKDAIEVMALGQCSRWNWEWDKMTPERRELSFSEMRPIVAALDAAGYAIVPKKLTDEQWAVCSQHADSNSSFAAAYEAAVKLGTVFGLLSIPIVKE